MKWSEVIAHKELSNLPFKVELNEWGNIVMSPASNRHGYIQTQLVLELNQQKQSGTVFTECSVETSKGVKVADVVWGSSVFFLENGLGGIARDLKISPETVIQIVKSHPEFFILASDERAKYVIRFGGLDAVSLTDSARNLYLQELTLSS